MGGKESKRAYRYRFYPTPVQAQQLSMTFGCVGYVYNRALAERSRVWAQEQRRVDYAETSRMSTQWKRDPETMWLAEPSKGPLQQALRNLQVAFEGFLRKRTGYPQFKKKGKSRDSATYFRNCFTYRSGRLELAKHAEPLDIRWSRPLPTGVVPSQVTVSRDSAGRYHISILVEEEIVEHNPADAVVGVDAGIASLYTFSTGEKVSNPQHEQRDRARLVKAQRALARKQKGSANRAKARVKVARIHSRIVDRRNDHLHKLSTRLVRENQVIAIEDSSVRNMVRNHRLARAISDAAGEATVSETGKLCREAGILVSQARKKSISSRYGVDRCPIGGGPARGEARDAVRLRQPGRAAPALRSGSSAQHVRSGRGGGAGPARPAAPQTRADRDRHRIADHHARPGSAVLPWPRRPRTGRRSSLRGGRRMAVAR
ncbi:RNA-guided endonuclease InsQ/TnpB family protein [Nocardia jiangxiensis]|uniref:RNA-guided endonuclease InsQ/TnpB family protein n=1 Tax=Nocardia jiangxiensis TaxID=282685 RepID=UPI00278BEB66|nr:transposase [Nocardia jiangxiensis]